MTIQAAVEGVVSRPCKAHGSVKGRGNQGEGVCREGPHIRTVPRTPTAGAPTGMLAMIQATSRLLSFVMVTLSGHSVGEVRQRNDQAGRLLEGGLPWTAHLTSDAVPTQALDQSASRLREVIASVVLSPHPRRAAWEVPAIANTTSSTAVARLQGVWSGGREQSSSGQFRLGGRGANKETRRRDDPLSPARRGRTSTRGPKHEGSMEEGQRG